MLPPPLRDVTPPPVNMSSTLLGDEDEEEPQAAIGEGAQAQLSPSVSPVTSPVRSNLISRPGSSSQAEPIPPPIQPPPPALNPSRTMQDILARNPTQPDATWPQRLEHSNGERASEVGS